MSRIYFEDLPSTNTPRNAENLNKLNNAVISSTEPNTGEEVWLQTSSNIFQLTSTQTINGITFTRNNDGTFNLSGTATDTAEFDIWANIVNSRIIDGQSYTLSVNKETIDFRAQVVCYNDDTWVSTPLGLSGSTNVATGSISLTGVNKIRFLIGVSSGVSVNMTNIGVKLERGTTATSFEALVNKKIYTKNGNGFYEEFYEEGYAPNGFYSLGEGAVNIPTSSGKLEIKKAHYSVDGTPNNGVVLQYGEYNDWNGQLFIGDNAEEGVSYNGWSNGVRGEWRKLAFEDNTNIYSTNEIRIGTWIDGKPLYRKVVYITLVNQYEDGGYFYTWASHGISNLDELTKIIASVDGTSVKIVSTSSPHINAHLIFPAKTDLQIGSALSEIANNSVATITMEYTKTTD